MKSFAETQKGKKVKKNNTKPDAKEDSEEEKEPAKNEDSVLAAREALKKKFSATPTKKTKDEFVTPKEEDNKGFQRRWVTVTDKVDKKAMDSVDVSLVKCDGQVNLEREMEKYLGGDDEVLAGFFNSDDELETINVADGKQETSKKGFFGSITSAFQSLTGNKVLTHDDMGPILINFAKALMDKNVA